jgi:hypothetical protein
MPNSNLTYRNSTVRGRRRAGVRGVGNRGRTRGTRQSNTANRRPRRSRGRPRGSRSTSQRQVASDRFSNILASQSLHEPARVEQSLNVNYFRTSPIPIRENRNNRVIVISDESDTDMVEFGVPSPSPPCSVYNNNLGDNDNDLGTAEVDDACVICGFREITHKLLPCGHAVFCEICCQRLNRYARQECAICRRKITEYLRI